MTFAPQNQISTAMDSSMPDQTRAMAILEVLLFALSMEKQQSSALFLAATVALGRDTRVYTLLLFNYAFGFENLSRDMALELILFIFLYNKIITVIFMRHL
jgi:hypothetical protein